jgi:two-component system NtrC family sensor kinase
MEMLDDAVPDLRETIAMLQRELDQRTAERDEALAQQAATSEILRVIARSPTDLRPAFEVIVASAARVCEAEFSGVARFEQGLLHLIAVHSMSPEETAAFHRLFPRAPVRNFVMGRAFVDAQPAHSEDVLAEPDYDTRTRDELQPVLRYRSFLGVPIIRDGQPIGVIGCGRRTVKPFTATQIELLKTFADQAAIAIDNVRLVGELETRNRDLGEALEQQTATAEVLQVINSSPGDLAPVFDALLEKALRLCSGSFGELRTYNGERFRLAATYGVPTAYVQHYARGDSGIYGPGTGPARILAGERVVHITDLIGTEPYQRGDPDRVALVDLGGARAYLLVPLLKDGAVLGYIMIYRLEVAPFSDKQIALLQNFATQAVIAMENARLLTETREALEQQTATAELLQVINSSPGDLAPVFDAMLEKAMRLCDAAFGQLAVYEDERFRTTATRGMPAGFVEYRRRNPPDYSPGTQPARLLAGERIIHVPDLMAEDIYKSGDPNRRALVDLGGVRSSLMVPLLREDAVLGFINIYRQEPRPFSDKQITLLESFAAQAVIAMDNARLLDEIRQRQAELRVTFDNMGDGVAMFDAELRLTAWNLNFQRILDLPDALLADRPAYADYIRILAERGEFGSNDIEAEPSRRLEDTDQELRLERTRPDGRVIEVRRNTVPGGGFVLIYSDITERKQAEEQIRAARDTAEAALRELTSAQASLIHAEKMASLGQLTAGIAHEIKNPLNFVNNFAGLSVELLDELREAAAPAFASIGDETHAEIDEIVGMLTGNLAKIAEHGRRADGIVTSMLAHSRGGIGEWRPVDINSLVDEALNLAYHGARAQDQKFNVVLERDLDHSIAPIELVPQDVTRVFLNLFGNGFYAANKRCTETTDWHFKPSLKVTTRETGAGVEIRVRDNGSGIPPEIRDKLFQPFFTTKPTGEGTGLGLSISYDIVTQQHGGRITVDSEVGRFTEFTIRLPRSRQPTMTGKTS